LSSGIPDPSACLLKYPAVAAIIEKHHPKSTQMMSPIIHEEPNIPVS